MKVQTSTLKLAYKTFIESILSYHITVIYGHLSADMRTKLNQLIKTARRLSNNQLECDSIEQVYHQRFETKCLRVMCSQTPPIEFDYLPSGRLRLPRDRINLRKFCFRTLCTKLLNAL
jgi:hypothetical protein